jgi:hypothetical protein
MSENTYYYAKHSLVQSRVIISLKGKINYLYLFECKFKFADHRQKEKSDRTEGARILQREIENLLQCQRRVKRYGTYVK